MSQCDSFTVMLQNVRIQRDRDGERQSSIMSIRLFLLFVSFCYYNKCSSYSGRPTNAEINCVCDRNCVCVCVCIWQCQIVKKSAQTIFHSQYILYVGSFEREMTVWKHTCMNRQTDFVTSLCVYSCPGFDVTHCVFRAIEINGSANACSLSCDRAHVIY